MTGRPTAYTLTTKIPMEQPMTGMTCTRCRTEDTSWSSFLPSTPATLLLSFFDLPRNRGLCRTGYLLRGRCRLNLINSMRHLDKCAPRTRIQRIIFILIHLPFPSFSLPCLSRVSLHLLFSSFSTAPYSLVARTVSSVIRSPIHTRQARAKWNQERERERERERKRARKRERETITTGGGRDGREKRTRFIRSHLSGVICLFDVAPYLIR